MNDDDRPFPHFNPDPARAERLIRTFLFEHLHTETFPGVTLHIAIAVAHDGDGDTIGAIIRCHRCPEIQILDTSFQIADEACRRVLSGGQ